MVASAGGKLLIYVSKRYETFDFLQHHMKICCLCFAEDAPFKIFPLFIILQFGKWSGTLVFSL